MLSPMTLLSRVVEVQVSPNSSTLMPPLPHDAQHADGADDDGVGGSPKGPARPGDLQPMLGFSQIFRVLAWREFKIINWLSVDFVF